MRRGRVEGDRARDLCTWGGGGQASGGKDARALASFALFRARTREDDLDDNRRCLFSVGCSEAYRVGSVGGEELVRRRRTISGTARVDGWYCAHTAMDDNR
eukprot:2475909-Rhodomonas_salina.2